MKDRLDYIRFNVLRNALYHTARRLRYERINRGMNFMVVLLGAASLGQVITSLSIPPQYIGLMMAAIAAAQLAFDLGGMSRTHQQLQRDYYNLLAVIEAVNTPNEKQCAQWYSAMIRISADEPPTMRAVDAKAYNDAISAMEKELTEQLFLNRRQRIFKHIISYEGVTFMKISERNQLALTKKSWFSRLKSWSFFKCWAG